MTQLSQPVRTIVAVCDRDGPDASRMDAYLREHELDARWYRPRDLDDVDREICTGRVTTAVFVRWDDLLAGLWNGEISLDRWLHLQTELRFVEPPGGNAMDYLARVAAAWSAHKRSRRQRQITSGIVLSLIALAAAFLVVQRW